MIFKRIPRIQGSILISVYLIYIRVSFSWSRIRHRITCIGVNISERKSGTERTKKRKQRELVIFHRRGAQLVLLYIVYRVFPRNNKVWAHGPMSLKFDGPFCNEWVNFFQF